MIYMLQIRSKLEQSAVVWHSGLTLKAKNDLERVQKSALRLILREKYSSYKDALDVIGIDSLEKRREKLCLKFAKACLRNEKLSDMFPKNKKSHIMSMRQDEKFLIRKARTERLQKSAIIYMQRLLNNEEYEKRKTMSKIKSIVPVNYDCLKSYH